jgi:hypothetical protein
VSSFEKESTTLRSRFGKVLVVIVWLIGLAVVVSLFLPFDLLVAIRTLPIVAFCAYGIWILFWSPSVTIAPSGVTIRNLIRTNEVTWPAIQRVDTRYALTLFTSAGKIVAWSAPAPGRHSVFRATRPELSRLPESTYGVGDSIRPGDIPQSDSGLAALYVRRYWEQLRDAGFLDSGAVEGTGVRTHWLVRETSLLVGLLVLSVLAFAAIP